jgi:hypothetical protein
MRGGGMNGPASRGKLLVANPAGCTPRGKVIVTRAISDEKEVTLFPGFRAVKPYIRFNEQPL